MILQPFHVKQWQFVDLQAISSTVEREHIQQISLAQLELMEDDAKCAALGISEVGIINNFSLGVYDPDGVIVGIFFIAALDYQSGPWADLVDWKVTNNEPAVFHARPMPGFPGLSLVNSLDLSVDAAHYLLANQITAVDGVGVEFRRFSWAIFQDRTDRKSRAMQRIHDHVKADSRLLMTEIPDSKDSTLTRVDIELA